MRRIEVVKNGLILIAIFVLIVVYKELDPSQNIGFPKCPSLLITGYQCAGCGSQRSIHHLLNFEFRTAIEYNPLVVLLIGYVMVLCGFEYSSAKRKFKRMYDILTGKVALVVLITTIIIYSIIRNL